MIRLSEAASLALHSMAILAQKQGVTVSAREIADQTASSQAHLAKVLQRLAKAGLLGATRGPKGGYYLAKKAADISLLNVYEAVEGELEEPSCLLANAQCPFQTCMFGNLFARQTAEIASYLSGKTLSDLAQPSEEWV